MSPVKFQSTLPGWGATQAFRRYDAENTISIHAPRMGSDDGYVTARVVLTAISIHAPRMGSDKSSYALYVIGTVISIHAPRMGSDLRGLVILRTAAGFQSTLPGWGATNALRSGGISKPFQSTLPGWGATMAIHLSATYGGNFNPRSPDGERPRKWTSSPTIWAKSSIFNTDCIADRR